MRIIGIDLGTTNSLVSCFQNGKSELIPNAHGDTSTPSVVSVLDSNEIVVGKAAKERLYTHPQLTAAAFKRFMGTKKVYELGPYTFSSVELSSLILKSLKADAEAALGGPVEEAVISVPAYFNDHQRRATKQAGELAGLRVERLISEPTAAAMAYGLHESGTDVKLLVFDLGGGTFDVSVVEIFDDILEVKAVAGDNFLGGEDFDKAVADYFVRKQGLADTLTDKHRSVIKEKAEAMKRALSDAETAEMRVLLDDTPYAMTFTRPMLEKISEPVLTRIRQPVLRALRDARLKPGDLSHVILVGGSSHMPLVRAYIAQLFGRLPWSSINADEAVGLGAGVCAALKERNKGLGERLMTDVCPYTLGTDAIQMNTDNVYVPILERNTVIPCSKVHRFVSAADNQTEIRVAVFQGENLQADQNLKLGELKINVPPKPRGQAAIDVRYTYDINGILEVEVTSMDTREVKREVILNTDNQLSPQEIEESLARLAALKIHPRDQSENRLLLARADRMFEETLGELRVNIGQRTLVFMEALNQQDTEVAKEAAQSFSEFLDEVEKWM